MGPRFQGRAGQLSYLQFKFVRLNRRSLGTVECATVDALGSPEVKSRDRMRASTLSLFLLPLLFGCATTDQPADLILTNGRLFTGVAAPRTAEAVAIRGDRIVAVGASSKVAELRGPATRVIDLHGRVVIPGINDAHVHVPWLEEKKVEASLPGEGVTRAILLESIRAALASAQHDGTITAALPLHLIDATLTRDDLDSISSTRPIRVTVFGGHSAILNTPALRAWGINEDAIDPPGGWYGRSGGRLNGWLFEHAYWIPQRRYAETLGDEEIRQAMREFEQQAVRLGITSVQTFPLISAQRTKSILASAPTLLRWRVIDLRMPPDVVARGAVGTPVKYILDGTPIERSAATRIAYADSPAAGRMNYSPAEIEAMVWDAANGGGQLHVHAVGDKTIAVVLDAMERTGADWPSLRVRIEHGDGTTDDLAERARKLGVVIVQNPAHFTIRDTMLARYGPRVALAQPARSLIHAGNRFALGSDGPLNPFLNIFFAAIHPTNPSESLTVEQSLRAYTQESAFAEFQERKKGAIEPGMLADLAVLSQDIFAIPLPELPKTRSVMTVIGGKVVWEEP
jgi:predicted amidohydrolase YtcJ